MIQEECGKFCWDDWVSNLRLGFLGTRGQGMGISPVTLTSRFLQSPPGPCWLSPLSLPHTWRGPALPDCQPLPKVSQSPLKSHFCAEKGKKAHEGGTGGGWNCGPAEILGEKRDWPHYQTWLQLVIRRKESFFVQLTDSEAWVGPVYRRPREWRHTDTQLGGEEGAEITGVVWVLFDELCQAQD